MAKPGTIVTRTEKSWFYSVGDHDEGTRFNYLHPTKSADHGYIVEGCADKYFAECDGWEDTWPLTFALYETEDGPEVGRFTVEREDVPTFSARAVPVETS